jgi:hypothetical protein
MDTIAKAERKCRYGFGTIFSFSNMNKRFQSSMSLEKRSTRFEYFSKLLYVAVNKSSSFKATENEITNAFEHSDYIRMSATTMISGML